MYVTMYCNARVGNSNSDWPYSVGIFELKVYAAASCRQYFNFKTIFYQVNYNSSGKPPFFPVTCLQYNNFIGSIPLQLDRKWF